MLMLTIISSVKCSTNMNNNLTTTMEVAPSWKYLIMIWMLILIGKLWVRLRHKMKVPSWSLTNCRTVSQEMRSLTIGSSSPRRCRIRSQSCADGLSLRFLTWRRSSMQSIKAMKWTRKRLQKLSKRMQTWNL